MSYYRVTYSDNYLSHHGIKGMKWGIRRYQNEDGTRTALGKQRIKLDNDKTISGRIRNFQYRSAVKRNDVDAMRELEDISRHKTALSKQIKDVKNTPEYKAERNKKIKKIMIGAAVVGSVALATYGTYKVSKLNSEKLSKANADLMEKGRKRIQKDLDTFFEEKSADKDVLNSTWSFENPYARQQANVQRRMDKNIYNRIQRIKNKESKVSNNTYGVLTGGVGVYQKGHKKGRQYTYAPANLILKSRAKWE